MDNASPNVSKTRVAITVTTTQEFAKSEALNRSISGIKSISYEDRMCLVWISQDCHCLETTSCGYRHHRCEFDRKLAAKA